jgi:hypothetical protein
MVLARAVRAFPEVSVMYGHNYPHYRDSDEDEQDLTLGARFHGRYDAAGVVQRIAFVTHDVAEEIARKLTPLVALVNNPVRIKRLAIEARENPSNCAPAWLRYEPCVTWDLDVIRGAATAAPVRELSPALAGLLDYLQKLDCSAHAYICGGILADHGLVARDFHRTELEIDIAVCRDSLDLSAQDMYKKLIGSIRTYVAFNGGEVIRKSFRRSKVILGGPGVSPVLDVFASENPIHNTIRLFHLDCVRAAINIKTDQFIALPSYVLCMATNRIRAPGIYFGSTADEIARHGAEIRAKWTERGFTFA